MPIAKGFWSYVHADDDAEGGRIADLARDLASQYEMLTAESIELFLDRDDLAWGNDWKAVVDGSLSATAFFIPVLTPRFFLSAECRRELNTFVRKARRLGLEDLIMPILYVDAPLLRADPPTDEAVAMVKPFQWVDWTVLRFASKESPEYRAAVASMADRLVEANLKADEANAVVVLPEVEDDDDDSLGSADLMAKAEEVMPAWLETVGAITSGIEDVSTVVQGGTQRLNEVGHKGFAARLTAMRQMAVDLQRPADNIEENAAKFTAHLNDVDAGVMEMIPMLAAEVEKDPSAREGACDFFATMRDLAQTADAGLGGLKGMVDSIQPIEGMSRDLRKPLKTLRRGLTSMYESRKVMNGWVTVIDETGIDCGA